MTLVTYNPSALLFISFSFFQRCNQGFVPVEAPISESDEEAGGGEGTDTSPQPGGKPAHLAVDGLRLRGSAERRSGGGAGGGSRSRAGPSSGSSSAASNLRSGAVSDSSDSREGFDVGDYRRSKEEEREEMRRVMMERKKQLRLQKQRQRAAEAGFQAGDDPLSLPTDNGGGAGRGRAPADPKAFAAASGNIIVLTPLKGDQTAPRLAWDDAVQASAPQQRQSGAQPRHRPQDDPLLHHDEPDKAAETDDAELDAFSDSEPNAEKKGGADGEAEAEAEAEGNAAFFGGIAQVGLVPEEEDEDYMLLIEQMQAILRLPSKQQPGAANKSENLDDEFGDESVEVIQGPLLEEDESGPGGVKPGGKGDGGEGEGGGEEDEVGLEHQERWVDMDEAVPRETDPEEDDDEFGEDEEAEAVRQMASGEGIRDDGDDDDEEAGKDFEFSDDDDDADDEEEEDGIDRGDNGAQALLSDHDAAVAAAGGGVALRGPTGKSEVSPMSRMQLSGAEDGSGRTESEECSTPSNARAAVEAMRRAQPGRPEGVSPVDLLGLDSDEGTPGSYDHCRDPFDPMQGDSPVALQPGLGTVLGFGATPDTRLDPLVPLPSRHQYQQEQQKRQQQGKGGEGLGGGAPLISALMTTADARLLDPYEHTKTFDSPTSRAMQQAGAAANVARGSTIDPTAAPVPAPALSAAHEPLLLDLDDEPSGAKAKAAHSEEVLEANDNKKQSRGEELQAEELREYLVDKLGTSKVSQALHLLSSVHLPPDEAGAPGSEIGDMMQELEEEDRDEVLLNEIEDILGADQLHYLDDMFQLLMLQ